MQKPGLTVQATRAESIDELRWSTGGMPTPSQLNYIVDLERKWTFNFPEEAFKHNGAASHHIGAVLKRRKARDEVSM